MRLNKEFSSEDVNSSVLNRIMRRELACPRCRPNKSENANKQVRDDRYKNHRRSIHNA